MLVVQRGVEESIVMTLPNGDQIIVRVCEFRSTKVVRIGVAAPGYVTISRDELCTATLVGGKVVYQVPKRNMRPSEDEAGFIPEGACVITDAV